MNSEYLLAILTIAIIPIILVIIVYAAILIRALRKLKVMRNMDGSSIATDAVVIQKPISNAPVTSNLEPEERKTCMLCCCCKSPSGENVTEASSSSDSEQAKWRAIKIVVLTSGTMAITMLPFFIVSLMYVYCECDPPNNPDYCDVLKEAIASPLTMLVSNSGLNPIIYAWWHSGFRTIRSMDFIQLREIRRRFRRRRTSETTQTNWEREISLLRPDFAILWLEAWSLRLIILFADRKKLDRSPPHIVNMNRIYKKEPPRHPSSHRMTLWW